MPNIEEHIRQAMQAGKFDDLPGKGKPLSLDENPLADPEWQLAFHMLKDAGFSLPWIESLKEIERISTSRGPRCARPGNGAGRRRPRGSPPSSSTWSGSVPSRTSRTGWPR